jgi:hypothetical protein
VDVQVGVKHAARYCHAAVTPGGRFAPRRAPCPAPPGPGHPGPRHVMDLGHGNDGTTDMIMAQIRDMRPWPHEGPGFEAAAGVGDNAR